MRYVIDASVAAKWLLPEDYTPQAESLLTRQVSLLAPDLLFAEVANVLWKRVARRDVTAETAVDALSLLLHMDIAVTPSSVLLNRAFAVACDFGRTVYDGLYLALAVEEETIFVTADKRFCNALRHTALNEHIQWIGDVRV